MTHTASASTSGTKIACANEAQLATALEAAKKRSSLLRRQVGELSCRASGIGPTGGFCLDPNAPFSDVGGNSMWSPGLGGSLMRLFAGGSVLDLGAGLGQYEMNWVREGNVGSRPDQISSLRMFDGAENVEAVTNGRVRWADLTEPLEDVEPADWVLSLEVGEHIPSGNATNTFVYNLQHHSKKGIVVSWAVPGQGGHHHINNMDADGVLSLFSGFEFDAALSMTLRQEASREPCCSWFEKTIYVFAR